MVLEAVSPIKYEKKTLEMIGKKLKKNSVSLDFVDFGEDEDGKPEKLEAFLLSVNNNDSSHIVHVPPGQNAHSDVLISTPLFTGDGEGGSRFAAAAGGVSEFDFGVDPYIDPELALALRVSMEEERARQEAAAKRAAEEATRQEKREEAELQSDSQKATMTATEKVIDPMDEDDALLKRAIALSMNIPGSDSPVSDAEMSEATNCDQDLALALQMSMQDSSKDSSTDSDVGKVLGDQSFMSSIILSLPGVDPNDPNVKDFLASLPDQSELVTRKE